VTARVRAGARTAFVAILLAVAGVSTAVDVEALPTPGMQERFDGLTHELRCMQCQNQSIADSPVGLASDLRRSCC
jgi:cytochrome c-type biogenesis protein CcmH